MVTLMTEKKNLYPRLECSVCSNSEPDRSAHTTFSLCALGQVSPRLCAHLAHLFMQPCAGVYQGMGGNREQNLAGTQEQ